MDELPFLFDLAQLTDQQLTQLQEAVQAMLLERQRAYLRECAIESTHVYQYYRTDCKKCRAIRVRLIGQNDGWPTHTQLALLEKREEVPPTFTSFTAQVGAILEFVFLKPRSTSCSRWYVMCEDGSLKRIPYDRQELTIGYVAGEMNLLTFLQRLDQEDEWDDNFL